MKRKTIRFNMLALIARRRDAYVKRALLARALAHDISQPRRCARQEQTIAPGYLAPQAFSLRAQTLRHALGQRVIGRTHHADFDLHAAPTLLLRRSSRITLRHSPLRRPMRSRI